MTDAFLLSPGITPLLTDLVLVEFVLLSGALYRLAGPRGFEAAVALNALLLGAIKLATDYTDLLDLPVALAGLVGGLFCLVGLAGRPRRPRLPKGLVRTLALVLGAVGLLKAGLDFYDPFDLLLSAVVMVLAFWWLVPGRPRGADPLAAVGPP